MLPSFVLPRDFIPNNFVAATEVKALETKENVYSTDIKRDWTAILVPNGGYLMSIIATAAQKHFETKRPELQQKDLITFHVEFLAKADLGYAEVHLTELKIGRQFSVMRAQLVQYPSEKGKGGRESDKKQARVCMEALVTQGNLTKEAQSGGTSLPTRKIDIPRRETFCEPAYNPDWPFIRPAAFKIQHTLPPGSTEELAHPMFGPSVREEWVRWAPGTSPDQGFTPLALPYLADSFRPLPEAYGLEGYWYPTLNYGLEIKKAPATAHSWDWLLLSIEVLEIRNGRYDMVVMIFEESGDLVALGTHVALLLNPADKAKKSKI